MVPAIRARLEMTTITDQIRRCLRVSILTVIIAYINTSYSNYSFKAKGRQKLLRTRLLMRLAIAGFATLILGILVTTGLFAYYANELPSPDKVIRREGFSTKIFDRKGKLLYDVYADQKRTPVELSAIPLTLQQATVAIEDKTFYKHRGFDPLTPLRIVWNLLSKRRLVGGSTLTQQLVKTVLLTPERTPIRKLKEFVLSLQVESKYNKDVILQMYLNEVPYGGSAYGVEAASETYFDKPVSQVNLAESAILAGLPQSPTYYSPLSGKAYIGRAEEVLRRMREDGYITTALEQDTKKMLPKIVIASQSGILKAPHFVFYVKDVLTKKYGESAVEEGGLNVMTTLDLDVQEAAQKIVSEEVNKVKFLNITNGAAMVLDPQNGQVLAMVGSRNWGDPDYDGKYNVTTAQRQPGSTIKPVTYLTALRKGYTAATMLMDVKTSFPGGDKPEYVPENYDGKFRGPVLVRSALANSLNIPAVKMLSMVGIRDMLQMAYEMGITTLQPTTEFMTKVGLSITLGSGDVKMIDMASAYSAFANGGKKIEPVAILKVTDSSGRVLEEWKDAPRKQVITPEEAFVISSILADPNARSITFGLHSQLEIPNKTVSVKTGTTNDKRDNWTIGWTPSVLTSVWVGNNNNSEMKQVASGVTGASPIWRRIMDVVLKGKPNEILATPSGIIEMDIDKVSGYPAHDGFESKKEYFIKGTEPTGPDPTHKAVKVCKGQNDKLAPPGEVSANNFDTKEGFYFTEQDPFIGTDKVNKWQAGIDEWLKMQADPKYHPPTEFCSSGNSVWITIKDPKDKTRINSNDVKIAVEVSDVHQIVQVDFYIDGNLKQSLTNGPWELTSYMTNGKHRIDIKAKNDQGDWGSRFVEIAVNEDWKD